MRGARWTLVLAALLAALGGAGCHEPRSPAAGRPAGPVHLVFKTQPLWGDPGPFRALIAGFERAHPGVKVELEYLPNASDLAHQYYLTSLEGGATEFDLMVVDVIWVPEFARAGWVADLSPYFPPEQVRRDFLPGPAEVVTEDGHTWALPWYVDVGILYYRKDWVPRPPRTYAELEQLARAAMAAHPGVGGYVWQGKQYEGLNCNVFEAIWGHGGDTLEHGRVRVDTPAGRAGLGYLRGLLAKGISPPSVTSMAEEESRRLFQNGQAVFMRNWPYAWAEAQKPDSPLRGKVGWSTLPTLDGAPGAGTLGGWQLAVNAHVPKWRQKLAAELAAWLTSPQANLMMAEHYARNPPRAAVYQSEALQQKAPFIASLLPAVQRARPRPVTPYYNLISDVLQGEFSAAISGLRSPQAALSRAQKLVDHIMAEQPRTDGGGR